ncbi:hypothetical protein EMCRGX_G026495 [Ephydatia muelleri]
MIEDDSCPEADGFVSDEEVIGIDDNGQQENVLSHETVNITQYITNFDSANSEIGYDSAIRCTEAVPFEQLFSNSEQEDDLSSEAVDIAEHVVNVGSENSECGNDSAIRCTEAVPFEQLFSNSEQEDDLSSEAVNIAEHVVNVGSENSECGNDSIRCTESVPFEQLFTEAVALMDMNVSSNNKSLGFRLCGDNLDKTIQRRHARLDRVNKELHCFNSYAVRNRVDISQLSDEVPHYPLHIDVYSILPSPLDDNTLSSNIATLVSRVLCKHMKFFNVSFDDVVQWHIHHKYYKEMSQKSQVVPLGIILKNENKIDEMTEILTDLHQYVPCVTQEESASLSTGQVVTKKTEYMHRILIGGDQLTVARMRSAINIKNNSWTATGRLEGFIPVAEDWHTKAIYLDLIWRYFYATSSSNQTGTLYHLKNLLNRTSIPKKAKKQYDACHDFFVLVVEAYILVAAMTELKMDNLDGIPDKTFAPQGNDTWMMPDEDRKQLLHSICNKLVNSPCFHLRYNKPFPGSNGDEVYTYSRDLLSLGCLYLEYVDSIKEGDGDRVLRCWRYLLPIFVASGRKNYAIESLELLYQHDYLLSEREKVELLWSRFINTHGKMGKNIPNDLHCEHLNRICKDAIQALKSNKGERAILRVSKALGVIVPILSNYDDDHNVKVEPGRHNIAEYGKDLRAVVGKLNDYGIFTPTKGRKHMSFQVPKNPLFSKTRDEMKDWIINHTKVKL